MLKRKIVVALLGGGRTWLVAQHAPRHWCRRQFLVIKFQSQRLKQFCFAITTLCQQTNFLRAKAVAAICFPGRLDRLEPWGIQAGEWRILLGPATVVQR